MNTKQSTLQMASNALQSEASEARDNIEHLLSLVNALAAAPRPDWGHVGSMGHVNELLTQAIKHLRGDNY